MPRIFRNSEGGIVNRSTEPELVSSFALPEMLVILFGSNPIIAKLVTVLPEPDSPTIARVSPRSILKDTFSTAFTIPSEVLNSTDKSFTSNKLMMQLELVGQ